MRGTLGSPGRLNLDRSWNRSCSVSPSSSSDVSSMVIVSSPSPTSRRSLALLLPSLEYPQVEEGKLGRRQTLSGHPAANNLGELDYYNTITTRRQSSITNLVWRTTRGVLGDWAGCVWWHIFEDPTQSLDDVFIVGFITGYPRRVVVAHILEPEGIARHQCSALSPASLKALIFCSSSGS
jgi:hypothetical protein